MHKERLSFLSESRGKFLRLACSLSLLIKIRTEYGESLQHIILKPSVLRCSSISPKAPGAVCPSSVEFVRLSVKGTNVKPQSFRGGDLILSNSYGNTTIPYRVKRLDGGEGWMGIVSTGGTYDWMFEDGETVSFPRI